MLDAEVKGRLSGLCEGRLVPIYKKRVASVRITFSRLPDNGLQRNFACDLGPPASPFRNVLKVVGLRLHKAAILAFLRAL